MYTPEVFLEHAQRFRFEDLATTTIDAVRTASETSTVARVLRSQRMLLPDVEARLSALDRLYEDVAAKRLRVAGDLRSAIAELGGQFQSSLVGMPLFFGLVNETYGPIRVVPDNTRRLRDRPIDRVIGGDSREKFVNRAHAGWLAQALYRIRLEGFGPDELLTGLFGPDPPQRRHLRCSDKPTRHQSVMLLSGALTEDVALPLAGRHSPTDQHQAGWSCCRSYRKRRGSRLDPEGVDTVEYSTRAAGQLDCVPGLSSGPGARPAGARTRRCAGPGGSLGKAPSSAVNSSASSGMPRSLSGSSWRRYGSVSASERFPR